jgi:L-ascorbate metabolism protein UlaG (beta-lactamase superfamily)
MRLTTIILVLSLLSITSFAQRPASDKIETSAGPLTIQPILHGALVLMWKGKTIYVDPYGGAKAYAGLAHPDLILITDIHGDHLNAETLNVLKTDKVIVVAPQAVVDQLPENLKGKAVVLNNGNRINKLDIDIAAMPMYNLPEAPDSRHTKGRGNGYVLNFGGKMIYISGDTEDIPEMRALKNIDVAFVCMNLPYTMEINQASSAVLEFKPKIVYPYHYRGQNGLADVEAFKKLVNDKSPSIDVRLRNWYVE